MEQNIVFKGLKAGYFIERIFTYTPKRTALEIIKCNRNLKKRVNITIEDYKKYCEQFSSIEIELIPIENQFPTFINIIGENAPYFHIYFNDNKNEEIKRYKLIEEDGKVEKINIIIDYHVDSFESLFSQCRNIEEIKFKKFLGII